MPRTERRELPRGVMVSKTLSKVLRHSAAQEKIELNAQGYAKVSDLLKWRKAQSLNITFEEIINATADNDKQRFALLYAPPANDKSLNEIPAGDDSLADAVEDLSLDGQKTSTQLALDKSKEDPDPRHYLIRATQGHSIRLDSAEYLTPITLDDPSGIPETAVHGTYHAAWPHILSSGGLKSFSRSHCHFASGPPLSEIMPDGIDGAVTPRSTHKSSFSNNNGGGSGAGTHVVISGMRSDAQILIYINVRRALESGLQFWRSENGVILSEGKESANGRGSKVVGTEFFDVVAEVRQGLGVLWRDGKAVKGLPAELVAKGPPRGKALVSGGSGSGSGRGRGGGERGSRKGDSKRGGRRPDVVVDD